MTKQVSYELNVLCHGCNDFEPNDIFEFRFLGHCCWLNKDLEKLPTLEEGCSGFKPNMEGF